MTWTLVWMILVLWFGGSIPTSFVLALLFGNNRKSEQQDAADLRRQLADRRPLTDDELGRMAEYLRK